ncbi:MAG: 2-C-methyl-D-erythritol 4-phosphate cytidylyltransferase [Bacteroidota bacterium]|jgi:2-C-methyl-D-erythritol 4-phosphate cytidylyltransferase
MLKKGVVITAAGSGTRMASSIPKQFLLLKNIPILLHTAQVFAAAEPEIEMIIVLPEEHMITWRAICTQHQFDFPHSVVAGGNTRFASVYNGIQQCAADLIAVHDGVRCLVSKALIQKLFSQAAQFGSAIPYIPISESLRKQEAGTYNPISRDGVIQIQTPQCFQSSILKPAFKQPYENGFTDEATVVEKFAGHLHYTEGERWNIKITFAADLDFANIMLPNLSKL